MIFAALKAAILLLIKINKHKHAGLNISFFFMKQCDILSFPTMLSEKLAVCSVNKSSLCILRTNSGFFYI